MAETPMMSWFESRIARDLLAGCDTEDSIIERLAAIRAGGES